MTGSTRQLNEILDVVGSDSNSSSTLWRFDFLAEFPSEAVAVAGGEGVICSPAMDGVSLSEAHSCVVRDFGAY